MHARPARKLGGDTSSETTVVRIAPSIVSSNMMTRFGHQATIGMPPSSSGHARSVPTVRSTPTDQADDAADGGEPEERCGDLSRWLNSKASNGSTRSTVMSRFGDARAPQAVERRAARPAGSA